MPALRHEAVAKLPLQPKRRVWLWVLGMILAAGLGLAYYLQPWKPAPIGVTVEVAEPSPVTRVLAVNGRIAALHSVDVRPLVSGLLAEVWVAEGDRVRSGAELARIDAAAQRAIVRQARAGLDGAIVSRDQAAAAHARAEALGANVARTELENAESAMQSAAQEAARMTALLDQAQIQLANFTIRAPMAGTVLTRHGDPGESVDPSTALLTIADLSQLIVETDVDEAYVTQIRAGLPAMLQLTGDPIARDGSVRLVSQRVDAATGGLAVKLSFDERVSAPVGLTVTANIIVDQRNAAITAPRSSIETGEDGVAVYVVTDGIATRRAVTVIDWPAARLIGTDGLAAGESIIANAAGISDGQPVQVRRP